MKTNELMLGDIITFKDSVETDETPIPVKVIALGYQHHGNENEALVQIDNDEGYDIVTIDDDFVGYPLTAEILEKNGFKVRGYEELVLETDEYCFALQKGVDGTNAWWWEMFSSPIVPINHVHELKRTLRLCGIKKEIVL